MTQHDDDELTRLRKENEQWQAECARLDALACKYAAELQDTKQSLANVKAGLKRLREKHG